jgi:hypothetical protein
MFNMIVFIIIVAVILNKAKKGKEGSRPTTPPITAQPKPKTVQPAKPNTPKKTVSSSRSHGDKSEIPVTLATKEEIHEHTAGRSYQANHSVGERYEEWMPLPSGKAVVRCNYCGADNLIPRGSSARHYTCYFCREEL